MLIWRYPYGKYDFETLNIMFAEFCARAGVNSSDVIAMPDDITIEKADRNFLIQLRNELTKKVEKMFYEPRCQCTKEEKPCAEVNFKCKQCEYYYSDADARWM